MAVQRAEITSKQTDFIKNKGLNSASLRRCSGTPLGGACLTLFFRKKCCGTPPGGATQLYFSLLWGLTDRQVSLPPFRVLPRSGGPELSKLGQLGTFLAPGFFFVVSWLPLAPLPDASASGARATPLGGPGLSSSWFSFRGGLTSASSFSGRFRVRSPSHPLGWQGFLLVLFSWGACFRQLLLRTLSRPVSELLYWVTRDLLALSDFSTLSSLLVLFFRAPDGALELPPLVPCE